MKIKFTLILLILNLALLAFFWLFEPNKGAESSFEKSLSRVLGTESIGDFDRIALKGKEVNWSLVRNTNNVWALEAPLAWPANPFAIEQLLAEWQSLQTESRFDIKELTLSGQSLADYGLESPTYELTLGHKQKTLTLKVGSATPIGERRYWLSPDGAQVWVMPERALRSLALPLESLAQNAVLNLAPFEVNSVWVANGNARQPHTKLNKTNNGWQFELPLGVAAEAIEVERALQGLTSLQATQLHPLSASAQGLETPRWRLGLQSGTRTHVLRVGNPTQDGRTWAQLEGWATAFEIPETAALELAQASQNWRSRQWLDFDWKAVHTLSISEGDRQLRLMRNEENQWQIAGIHSPQPAENSLVEALLEQLWLSRVETFVTDAPAAADLEAYGLNPPQKTLTLISPSKTLELRLGNTTEGNTYTQASTLPTLFTLPSKLAETIKLEENHYKSRTLLRLPEEAQWVSLKLIIDQRVYEWDLNPSESPFAEEVNDALMSFLVLARHSKVAGYLSLAPPTTARIEAVAQFTNDKASRQTFGWEFAANDLGTLKGQWQGQGVIWPKEWRPLLEPIWDWLASNAQ